MEAFEAFKCAIFCGIIGVVAYDIRYPLEELLFGEDEDDDDDNDNCEVVGDGEDD